MSGDLLDRASRQVQGIDDPSVRERIIIDLIERVRTAEADLVAARAGTLAEEEHMLRRDAERAEAAVRGKLDAVRGVVTEELECLLHPDDDPVTCGWKQAVRRVAAIVGAEGSTRPQEATGDMSGTPGPDSA